MSANFLKSTISRIGLQFVNLLCKREYNSQQFTTINERPIEFEFLFRQLGKTAPKTVLDVGTGLTSLPHLMRSCGYLVSAVDNIEDYWPNGMINRHFHVINDDITKTKLDKKFDFISCISTLEHIIDHPAALRSMFSLLNPGGHIVLTFPYSENSYCENVYKAPGSTVKTEFPFVTQAYSRKELDSWIVEGDATIVEQEYWKYFTGDYWTCGEMLDVPEQVGKDELHQISTVLIRANK